MKPPTKIPGTLYVLDAAAEETVFEGRPSSPRSEVAAARPATVAPASGAVPVGEGRAPERISTGFEERPFERPRSRPDLRRPSLDGAMRPATPHPRSPSVEGAPRPAFGVPTPPSVAAARPAHGAVDRPSAPPPASDAGLRDLRSDRVSRPVPSVRPPSFEAARPDFSRRSSTTLTAIEAASADPSLVTERASASADRFTRNLVRSTPQTDALFVEPMRALGVAGLDALAAAFPGPLRRSLLDPDNPPRGREISAIAAVLHALGATAHAHVRRLLGHENPRVRHAALLLASDMDAEALRDDIDARLFDDDAFVAALAERIVEARGPGRNDALAMRLASEVRSRSAPPPRRMRAVELIGTLRLERGLSSLVDCLEDADRPVAQAVCQSLRTLTAHDFGTSQRDWVAFVRDARARDRHSWLLTALVSDAPRCRDLAAAELRRLTREPLGYVDGCSVDEARRIQVIYARMLSR